MMKTSRAMLRSRWAGEEERIAAIVADLIAKRDWTRHLLDFPAGSGRALPHLASCRRKALESDVAPRDLRGITLRKVNLSETEGLADAALDHAVFDDVQLYKASLRGSSLVGVTFRRPTSLKGAVLQLAKLNRADCRDISLNEADLRDADLRGCDFRGADLRGTRFAHAKYNEEGALGFLAFRPWTKFGGELQTFENILPENSLQLRRHIARSTMIEERKQTRTRLVAFFDSITNYGRSATRFSFFVALCWLFFALMYASLPVPRWLEGTAVARELVSLPHAEFQINGTPAPLTLGDGLYLSAVTITTLGYGDIVPARGDIMARLLVTAEAITGVIILGAFINMLVQNAVVEGD